MKPRSVVQYLALRLNLIRIMETHGFVEYERLDRMEKKIDLSTISLRNLFDLCHSTDEWLYMHFPGRSFEERDGEIIAVVSSSTARFESSLETWDIPVPSGGIATKDAVKRTTWRKA